MVGTQLAQPRRAATEGAGDVDRLARRAPRRRTGAVPTTSPRIATERLRTVASERSPPTTGQPKAPRRLEETP